MNGLGVGIDTRYIASFKECGTSSGSSDGGKCYVSPGSPPSLGSRTIHAYNQWNGFVSYWLKSGAGKTSLMLGVSNIFNTRAPIISSETFTNSDAVNYDYMGRYHYVRLVHAI